MSKDNVKKMFEKFEKEGELKNKFATLMQAHRKEADNAMADKLVELGRTSGFAFSKDDLFAARVELVDNANKNRELSENDLARVAGGGKNDGIYFSITSYGTACALISAHNESEHKGQCGQALSTKNC